MTSYISAIGVQYQSITNLQNEQSQIALLDEQLASGTKHNDLTDYDPSSARQLLDLQNSITQRNGYVSSIQTAQAQTSNYDTILTDIEKIASGANSLASQSQTYDSTKLASIQSQTKNYLQQLGDDLNQQFNGRYVFAGARYNTQPVKDLTTLAAPTSTTTTTAPALPEYDTAYTGSSSADANAYAKAGVTVDINYNISYGISSDDPSFQKLVQGLRYLYAASQATDATTYQTNLSNASTLLGAAIPAIEGVHTTLSGNIGTLSQELTTQQTDITNLQNELGNIQDVDTSAIGVQLNLLQSQIQASYSATASLTKLSIVQYL